MITIPTFVPRGLAMMTDPSRFDSVSYNKEEHLRDAMAALWWLNGWSVRTEVKVPDCGRIDVLAELNKTAVVIELKKAIRTPTTARQAFQQAHAYDAYLRAEEYESGRRRNLVTIVTAGDYEANAMVAAERAYGDVNFMHFMGVVEQSYAPHSWLLIAGSDLDSAATISRHRATQLALMAKAARMASVNATRLTEDRTLAVVA